jgi:hypothetical protein
MNLFERLRTALKAQNLQYLPDDPTDEEILQFMCPCRTPHEPRIRWRFAAVFAAKIFGGLICSIFLTFLPELITLGSSDKVSEWVNRW